MSNSRFCGNPDVLMSYLYEDGDEAERRAFAAHLPGCAACSREVEEFRAVRGALGAWTPPERVLGFRVVRDEVAAKPRTAWFRVPALPVWAQLAAASLVVGMAAGLAGLEIRYDAQGFVVRTGWGAPASQTPGAAPSGDAAQMAKGSEAPWRADLVALSRELRGEIQAQAQSAPSPGIVPAASRPGRAMSDEEFLATMRRLVEASEQRQQRELALRLSEVMRDVETQRRVDLARVANSLGIVEGRAGLAVAEQRDMLNYLMRVSSREQK
jgi:anti-sigma factor RsiW